MIKLHGEDLILLMMEQLISLESLLLQLQHHSQEIHELELLKENHQIILIQYIDFQLMI